MRLVDADELIEHAWRDKLDSRELIAEMIEKAPTIKEISTKIPINVFEQLISQEPKTGHWILTDVERYRVWHCHCSECDKDPQNYVVGSENWWLIKSKLPKYCPNCGAKMAESEVEDGTTSD